MKYQAYKDYEDRMSDRMSDRMQDRTRPTERMPSGKRIREEPRGMPTKPSEKKMPKSTKRGKATLLRSLGLDHWFEAQ